MYACKGCRCCRAVGLSTCRVSGAVGCCRTVGAVSGRAALLCGVRLAPRFDPDNSKQGVEESNPNMHTLKYMRLKISLNPRSSVRLRPFKDLKKFFDLHRKKTGESSAKMNIPTQTPKLSSSPWHVSLALLDPCWTSLSATSTQGAQGCLGQHLLAWAFVPLWCSRMSWSAIFWHGPLCSCALCFLRLRNAAE